MLIARQANRLRESLRPTEPTDLNFSLEEQHIPENFLQKDLTVNGRRHLVFATAEQLVHLHKAKTWYIDGTFKLVRHPFTQLLTINAFVRKEQDTKQVPPGVCTDVWQEEEGLPHGEMVFYNKDI